MYSSRKKNQPRNGKKKMSKIENRKKKITQIKHNKVESLSGV